MDIVIVAVGKMNSDVVFFCIMFCLWEIYDIISTGKTCAAELSRTSNVQEFLTGEPKDTIVAN